MPSFTEIASWFSRGIEEIATPRLAIDRIVLQNTEGRCVRALDRSNVEWEDEGRVIRYRGCLYGRTPDSNRAGWRIYREGVDPTIHSSANSIFYTATPTTTWNPTLYSTIQNTEQLEFDELQASLSGLNSRAVSEWEAVYPRSESTSSTSIHSRIQERLAMHASIVGPAPSLTPTAVLISHEDMAEVQRSQAGPRGGEEPFRYQYHLWTLDIITHGDVPAGEVRIVI